MTNEMNLILSGEGLNLLSIEGIRELLRIVSTYIVYIYPGFITLSIYNFARAKKLEKNKLLIIESFCISLLYVLPISYVLQVEPQYFKTEQHISLIILAILCAIGLNLFVHTQLCRGILNILGINTTVDDSIMDIMFYKGKRSVYLTAYMDEKKIMYEGWLIHYEPDLNRTQQIVLSNYRQCEYNEKTKSYNKRIDYSNDSTKYVRLLEENITRMEFDYNREPSTLSEKIDKYFDEFIKKCKLKLSQFIGKPKKPQDKEKNKLNKS